MPLDDPQAGTVQGKALSSDSEPYDNDGPPLATSTPTAPSRVTAPRRRSRPATTSRRSCAGTSWWPSCAGDAQYWDVTDRGNPSSADGEAHTHIQREVREDDPSTPDERALGVVRLHPQRHGHVGRQGVGAVDESGGGVEPRCDGDETKRGWTLLLSAGEARPAGRRVRRAGPLHHPAPAGHGDLRVAQRQRPAAPRTTRYWQVQAYLPGRQLAGSTSPTPSRRTSSAARTSRTRVGKADSWSTYWYNDVMYVNGGLGRRGDTANRGFEAYALYREQRRTASHATTGSG